MIGMLHIVIAESSDVVRRGIRSIVEELSPALSATVSEVSGTGELRVVLASGRVDILIINPSLAAALMPDRMAKEFSSIRCVMLQTTLADSSKAASFDGVISIYDSAWEIREKLSRLVGEARPTRSREPLSQREKDIVVCVVKGMTNLRIAEKLHISPHTVNTHRRNISSKLDIHSTSGLTVWAISNKLVRLDELGANE